MQSAISTVLQSVPHSVLVPGEAGTRAPGLSGGAPAISAMTDFHTAPFVATVCGTSIEDAGHQMKLSGARFAFVLDRDGHLVGSVTLYDIQGEKPVQYMLSVGCSETTCAWRDVQVEDIMEPVEQWRVLDILEVNRLSVDQLLALLGDAGLRYLVVVEDAREQSCKQVRGLFSAARLQQLLAGHGPQVPAWPLQKSRDVSGAERGARH